MSEKYEAVTIEELKQANDEINAKNHGIIKAGLPVTRTFNLDIWCCRFGDAYVLRALETCRFIVPHQYHPPTSVSIDKRLVDDEGEPLIFHSLDDVSEFLRTHGFGQFQVM